MRRSIILVFFLAPNFVTSQGKGSGKSKQFFGPSYTPSWYDPGLHASRMSSSSFGYKEGVGPEHWHVDFPECGGRRQSPINVITKSFVYRDTKTVFRWRNYNKVPAKLSLENSGHSLHLTGFWPGKHDIPYITGGPLLGMYPFSQLHFHWGKDNRTGSEHTINGKRYPMEMHVVHARSTDRKDDDGDPVDEIAVVGYLFEVSDKDNPSLDHIIDGIRRIQGNGGQKTHIRPFPLSVLGLEFNEEYVVYRGSLTTPPCTEGVAWILSSKPLYISNRQLEILRSSILTEGGCNVSNVRPTQQLNQRSIYYVRSAYRNLRA